MGVMQAEAPCARWKVVSQQDPGHCPQYSHTACCTILSWICKAMHTGMISAARPNQPRARPVTEAEKSTPIAARTLEARGIGACLLARASPPKASADEIGACLPWSSTVSVCADSNPDGGAATDSDSAFSACPSSTSSQMVGGERASGCFGAGGACTTS